MKQIEESNEDIYVSEPCWYCHYDHPRWNCECAMCDCEEPDDEYEEDN